MDERLYEQIRREMNRPGEFTSYIGVEITRVSAHEAQGVLHPGAEHVNPVGSIHGGCICTLMDAVGGAAGASSGYGCVTIDCDLHFLRASDAGEALYCQAKPIKLGKRIQVFDVVVWNDRKDAVAKGIYTYQLVDAIQKEEVQNDTGTDDA